MFQFCSQAPIRAHIEKSFKLALKFSYHHIIKKFVRKISLAYSHPSYIGTLTQYILTISSISNHNMYSTN